MSKKRTITLTDRRPITVNEDDWPVIASARWWEGEHEFQAFRRASVRVRQHADGRAIVYGVGSSNYRNERPLDAGYLLATDAGDEELVNKIHQVADAIGHPHLADECIADLPSVEVA